MKRRSILIVMVLVGTILGLNSCKKGENDPFVSLKSRDGRIMGIWKLTTSESISTTTTVLDGTSLTSTTKRTFDGTKVNVTPGLGDSYSYSYSEKLTINEDGSYSLETVNDGDTDVTEGYWMWIDSDKNKLFILLDEQILYIDQLKNKEMVLKYEYSYKEAEGNDSETHTSTSTSTYTKE
jgi:hypothetical protein